MKINLTCLEFCFRFKELVLQKDKKASTRAGKREERGTRGTRMEINSNCVHAKQKGGRECTEKSFFLVLRGF